jgi:superfamily II DNA or RNA helicase
MTCAPEDNVSGLDVAKKMLTAVAIPPPSQDEAILGTALTLRAYQAQALQTLRAGLAGGLRRQMLFSPTGSGKTEIAIGVIRGARLKGKRVVFLCNRVNLVEQASRRFLRAGIMHGIIQGANTTRVYEHVLVASIQTVTRRGGLPPVDLIVIDEAHAVAGSKAYRAVIAAAKGIPVIGLSATPYSRGLGKHYDDLGGALFEQMVIASTITELIAQNYLVDCDVYAPSEPDMVGIKQSRNAFGELDYTDADVGRATDKPQLIGDIIAHWFRLAAGTATVCFASNIAHSKHIVEGFLSAGVPAEHIDCYTPEDERQAILRRIETGQTLVISNVGVLAEGWDFPACKTLILARPTKSLIRYIQMAGRVLRPHESKVRALILDHSGTVHRLGFPTEEFPLELDDGTPKDAAASKAREKPLPKPCSSCSYMKMTHMCPACGFAPERKSSVAVEDGELVRIPNKPKNNKMGKQDFYSQACAIAASKGYQLGWAAHLYKDYFGVWPKALKEVVHAPTAEVLNFVKYRQIRHAKSRWDRHAAD